jgi:hypothetical protein
MWYPTLDRLPPCPAGSEQLAVGHGGGFYAVYWAPRIDARFHSAAHDAANLTAGTARSVLEDLPRLCAGGKPLTIVPNAAEIAPLAGAMLGKGMELRRGANPRTLVIAMTGTVGDRLDVEALICDWCAYLADCDDPAVLARVCEELRRVAAQPFTAFAGDEDVITEALPNDPGGWARAGLLYGYPPASTAAIVGMGLRLDGFAEIDVHTEEPPYELHEPGWMAPAFTGTSEQASALAVAHWCSVAAILAEEAE